MKDLNGFERRTLVKKNTILDASLELFIEKSAAKTTVSEIAKRAEVSQVSIYNYFESKDGLIEILIRRHLDKGLFTAEEILNQSLPFKEKLSQFLLLGKKIDKETDQRLLLAFDWKSKLIQDIYNRYVAERQIPFLIRFIENGKEEGEILSGLSTEAILAYFHANMQIYSDPKLLEKGKEYIANLSHLFYYGILGK